MGDIITEILAHLHRASGVPIALLPGIATLLAVIALFPWLDRTRVEARAGVILIAMCLGCFYMSWRLYETLPAASATAGFMLGLMFISIELIETLRTAIFLAFMTRTRSRTADVERGLPLLLALEPPPLVAMLICTYNEEEAILERTIVGAMSMDYPNYRVFVLDDGKRPWLHDLCAHVGCGYVTRPDNSHAKAGNINNGLRHLGTLETQPHFISILDADFVTTPAFLSRAMSLFADDSVGIVQTPQHFVNSDPVQSNLIASDVWPDEQRLFFDVIMPAKDACGLAICCGTSSIIRAKALTAIGGFPTDSVTEDYLVTLRLKEIGFKTIYLNEPLTFGLAPEGLQEYITQRARWCLGLVQIVRGRSGPFSRNALTSVDRLGLIESFLGWGSTNVFRFMGLVIPALFLVGGIRVVEADTDDLLTHFLPYFIWQSAVMIWISAGRVMPVMTDVCQLISAPSVLKAIASGLLRPKDRKFKVTAKGGDRSKGFVEWGLIRLYGSLLAFNLLGMAIFSSGLQNRLQTDGTLAFLWCAYNAVVLLLTCIVCVEQPRRRLTERFETGEMIEVQAFGDGKMYRLVDVSISGALIAGVAPDCAGASVEIGFAGTLMSATIERVGEMVFAIAFERSFASRAAMIRHVYSGRYAVPLGDINALAIWRALFSRAFH